METSEIEKTNYIIYILSGKVCKLNDYTELKNIAETVKQKNKTAVLDLSKIIFIASQGLGTLISISRSLSENGINLILYNPGREIFEEIKLASIELIIPIAHTEEELQKMI